MSMCAYLRIIHYFLYEYIYRRCRCYMYTACNTCASIIHSGPARAKVLAFVSIRMWYWTARRNYINSLSSYKESIGGLFPFRGLLKISTLSDFRREFRSIVSHCRTFSDHVLRRRISLSCLPVSESVCLPLCARLSTHLSLYVCLCLCLSARLSFVLYVIGLSICTNTCLSV